MEPALAWVHEWLTKEPPPEEKRLARELVAIFEGFWRAEEVGNKSKTTQRRYSAGLHALGGYLVARGQSEDGPRLTALDLLWAAVEVGEAPLIHPHDELWQREIDAVCRRLRRHLLEMRLSS